MPLDEYRQANLDNWNDRTAVHAVSRLYDLGGYVADPNKISGVVEFDRHELGDVRGKSLLHLQCHIGTDTLSLARLGAHVTGIDYSPDAIATARRLSADCDTPGRFEVAELYDTPEVIAETFDIVYTGVGALTWLPDIAGWGCVVAAMLKPGGTVYVRDFHPALLAVDGDRKDETLVVRHPYFSGTPLRFENESTYTDGGPVSHTVNYEWNHSLSEIVMSLLDNGRQLEFLHEHRFAESQILNCLVEGGDGRWRLPGGEDRLPLMFSLQASKPAWR